MTTPAPIHMPLPVSEDAPVPAGAGSVNIEAVYRTHGHSVLRRATAVLGDEHEAQEVLQEIFVQLLDSPACFAGRASITTWLYRVTTNMCLNRIRNRKTRRRLLDERLAPAVEEAQPSNALRLAQAREFLARMPDDLARTVVYHSVDGMTHGEIAEVMGCSRRHVGNLLRRAQKWVHAQEH